MIDLLSEWLKEIILIVLLASFVDLLLPNSSFQKYARMVMGLLIILTIISPIFSIFSEDFSVNNIIRDIENEIDTKESTVTIGEEAINSEYEEKMVKEVEERMFTELKPLVENNYNAQLKDLNLDAYLVNEKWEITQLDILISEEHLNSAEINETASDVETVQPIAEINIEIAEAKENDNKDKKVEENTQLINDIKELVYREWGLDKEKIAVYLN